FNVGCDWNGGDNCAAKLNAVSGCAATWSTFKQGLRGSTWNRRSTAGKGSREKHSFRFLQQVQRRHAHGQDAGADRWLGHRVVQVRMQRDRGGLSLLHRRHSVRRQRAQEEEEARNPLPAIAREILAPHQWLLLDHVVGPERGAEDVARLL